MATVEVPVTVKREELAPDGISGDLLIVPTVDDEDPEPKLHANDERDFFVYCLFSREAGFSREFQPVVAPDRGESFLRPRYVNGQLLIEAPSGDFRFVTNATGEFASVTWRGRARTTQDARQIFLAGITPALDHLAYLANTPLIISNVVAQDIRNNVFRRSYVTPYQDKNVGLGDATVHHEMIPIYGLYRESKNSASPFYRFLCLYKILEGIFGHLRPAAYAKARQMSVEIRSVKEVIPDHPELRRFHAELVGRPIKTFLDNELQAKFRNAVAHFLLDSGTPLNPSDPTVAGDFQNVILPTELACRVVIDRHQEILDQLFEHQARAAQQAVEADGRTSS